MNTALIVGGGINGLCTARALTLRGWQVTVVEREPLPNPLSASWDHHRLIRSHYAGQPHYAGRMAQAYAAWDRLFTDIDARPYVARGVFALSRNAGDWTDIARAELASANMQHQIIPPEDLPKTLPMVESEGVRYALVTQDGGALLSDRIVEGLLRWLTARGVTLIPDCPVTQVDADTAMIQTARGSMQADRLIVAAGVGLPALNPWFAQNTHARRATVVYADPPAAYCAAWQNAPAWVDMGGQDDLWGIPPVAGLPLKLGYGLHTQPGDPETQRDVTPDDTATILNAYRGRLRDLDQYTPIKTVANFYLMAPSQDFVLRGQGRTLWLSADSGHGFKFGALTGEDAADAITGDWRIVATRLSGNPP
ncbi:sarcosine oxidase/sarcosine oxidase subunit beta [Monaibacterium marinum]|uniref:Sarcosine oxidase/sarcosine oxidase subunit beta n=1 Tax=Pontivivens marinum TaxID=1690039 RepID=A0A2C9CSI8_9RHOB|nr:FAD-dependent oxidoreductase [Monaibacterium marinum]SOH94160.1 sarcosine oxidase/sarcosine oxidase subunit beta [Monaibacterium marinum]